MDKAGLKVRCLASTRFYTQEVERNDGEGDGVENMPYRVNGGEEIHQQAGRSSSLGKEAGTGNTHVDSDVDSNASSSIPQASPPETSTNSSHHSSPTSPKHPKTQYASCIQEAQLSPDGTCIFTSDYSRIFSVYPIATNILSESQPQPLKPYAQFSSPNPIWAYATNPLFNLQDANTTHLLVSRRDSYITLHNALWDISWDYEATTNSESTVSSPVDISKPLASYKLVNHLTEAVVAPTSLAYSHDGAYFFAGMQNAIVTFDLEYMSDPIHTIATIPSARNKLKGGGRGFKGCISALSLPPSSSSSAGGLLAAGARTRYVGIYDSISGEEVTHFPLPGTLNGKKIRNENLQHVIGDGVSHLKWSPCGRYLYVAERQSDALLIYDVRNFSLSLGYCAGRKALTKQKLSFDIWNAGASPYDIEAISHEVWAGGTDGMIRMWKDPYRKEGAVEPDEVVQVNEDKMPVVSALVHSCGSLAVAASGKIDIEQEEDTAPLGSRRGGGGTRPKYRERGTLDIIGLG